MTHVPRRSAMRHKLGIRWPRVKDWLCRRHGHVPSDSVSVQTLSGAYWPLCERCGYAIEPEGARHG